MREQIADPFAAYDLSVTHTPGMKTQFGSVAAALAAGKSWGQVYSLAEQGGYGFGLSDYYAARSSGTGLTDNPHERYGPNYQKPLDPGSSSGQFAGLTKEDIIQALRQGFRDAMTGAIS